MMITKTLWKDMIRAIKKSKGRFFSLMCLMALGSFALVGLKVTGPDMERTASHYLEKQQVMDMAVLASHQFSQEDRKELNTLKDVVLEYGHLIDLNITKDQQALRLYSLPNKLSKPLLVEGHWPKQDTEIVLSTALEKSYQLGDTIRVTPPSKGLLTSERFRVVGFAHSSELWSKSNLGGASAGDGSLYAYAFSRPNVFKGDANILRLRFNNLRFANAFSKQYRQTVTQNQTTLDQLLQDNSQRRYEELKGQYKLALTNGKAKLQSEQATLAAREQELGFLKGSALQEAKDQLEQAHKAMEQEKSRLRQVELAQSKLERPYYTTYNRSTLPGAEGYRTYATSISSISNVGNIFPLVLYLVAALVAFTTMTRYVDEERTTSGLLKALGYSNREISLKFLGYGLIASFLGTSLGILGGTYVLPALISDILTAPLTIGKTHLYFYDAYSALAYLLALLSTVLPAYLVVKKELFLNAAQLLLPKPPSKGANIWLENISLLFGNVSRLVIKLLFVIYFAINKGCE